MFDNSTRISLASLYVLFCVGAPSLRAADDPKEIVRRALRINARNRGSERSYTYAQRDESARLTAPARSRGVSPRLGMSSRCRDLSFAA
jgi:hypothetical protein